MADEIIAPPSTPEASTELTLDQQLEALRPTGKETVAPAAVAAPTPPAKAGEEAPKPEASQDGASNEPTLEQKLEQIEDTPLDEGDKNKPQLSTDQQRILEAIPDVQTAQALGAMAQGYQNLTAAFEGGDFKKVETMFQQWNPKVWDTFLEHIYAQKVASGEWVDRWVGENDPKAGPVNKSVKALEQKIAQLEKDRERRAEQERSSQDEANQQRTVKQYVDHIDALFDQINFAKADRRYIMADINNRVMADSRVKSAINSGNIAAVNKVFKDAVREFVDRDKVVTKEQTTKFAAQATKKAPMESSAIVTEGGLPDDIKAVPKGQEDNWMDQQFAKLAKLVKR